MNVMRIAILGVAAIAAVAADAEGHSRGDALELMREQRRVGRDDDDDRSVLLIARAGASWTAKTAERADFPKPF